MPDLQNSVTFHDGRTAPKLGLGVWQIPNDKVSPVVQAAIKTGYRLIDTAAIYGNETGVGQGIAHANIERNQLFITTKLWNDRHDYDSAMAAFDESLNKLGLDYIDLYLIHWPAPITDLYVSAWKALIQLHHEGRAKSIGVCNFTIEHLQRLIDESGVLPVVNQIELHPKFQQAELREYHAAQGIVTEAWSPLGQGAVFQDAALQAIAHKHRRSVAQIILRWHLQLANMAIPKSSTPRRLQENFDVFDFKLDKQDMATIAALDEPGGRMGPDPESLA